MCFGSCPFSFSSDTYTSERPAFCTHCDADATALMQAKTAMQGQTFSTVYVSMCADIHHFVLNTLLPIEDAKIHCHLVSLSLFRQGEAVQGG